MNMFCVEHARFNQLLDYNDTLQYWVISLMMSWFVYRVMTSQARACECGSGTWPALSQYVPTCQTAHTPPMLCARCAFDIVLNFGIALLYASHIQTDSRVSAITLRDVSWRIINGSSSLLKLSILYSNCERHIFLKYVIYISFE